jgi:predicted Zn-dependent protease
MPINTDNLNAFVLPGGKVFVYSGILRVTRTESGLATVLGHEVAHNLAQHHGERQSAAIGSNILLYSMVFLLAPVGALFYPLQVFMGGLLDLMFERPMGRLQESEADYIGLMLMAEACYDPREAVGFWKRMASAAKQMNQGDIPEWISTHPSVRIYTQELCSGFGFLLRALSHSFFTVCCIS